MNLIVRKTETLKGQATPPSSKSQSIRGLLLSLLAKGQSTLMNVLDSDDMQDAMHICKQLGAHLTLSDPHTLVIESRGLPLAATTSALYSGNSGITTHFVLPLLGLRENPEQPITLDCGTQMRARPIQPLVQALTQLGLTITYLEKPGSLPIRISGRLSGGKAEVDGITSQYISALLLALPCASSASEICVTDLRERPYMEMTLNWLKEQHIIYTHNQEGERDIYHIPGHQTYSPFRTLIPADFSSASYLITAAVLTQSEISLVGLNMADAQGDKRLVTILQAMGADIRVEANRLVIKGGRPLNGLNIDANDIPDLLPVLAVIGTKASGHTDIVNVKHARIKETDRIHAMTEGLTRLGARIEEHADGMTIHHSHLQGTLLNGYDDHRTVMALSIAGLVAEGVTSIAGSEAINKTFPHFVAMMTSLGANMEVQHASAT